MLGCNEISSFLLETTLYARAPSITRSYVNLAASFGETTGEELSGWLNKRMARLNINYETRIFRDEIQDRHKSSRQHHAGLENTEKVEGFV